jgi:uncharacterized membrane protein YbhN (UPF0104 family)/tRNA A-37 threonylcarbamoyl transferase component Bud32
MTDPDANRRSARFFLTDTGISRRPIDVLVVIVGVVIALVSTVAASSEGGRLDAGLIDVADDLPGWATNLFDAAYALGALFAVTAVVFALVTAPRRARLPFTLALAAVAAVAGVVACSFFAGGGWPDLNPGPVHSSTPDSFPTVRVAVTTGVLMVLRPWLVLAYRRLALAIVAVQCVAAWSIGSGGATDVIGALGVGMAAAGVALVVVGSPAGHPDLGQVRRSLGDLGVEVDELGFAENQPWGTRVLHAMSRDGAPLVVKVYGRDAADAHRAARRWRALVYRDQSAPDATRLQLVEHEALMTILAERVGVGVQNVVAAASTHGDAVLVLGAPPRPLVDVAMLEDATLRDTWAAVARLHGAGLVHGRLTLDHVGLDPDGNVVLSDFSDGRIAATPGERGHEVAVLLTAQAVQVGVDRATQAALDILGPDAVAAALPYLQRVALPRPLRAANGVKATISGLTAAITERTGVAAPDPAPIVRLSWRDLLQTVLILVAAYALLTTLAGLDWETVLDTWRNATWAWVLLGLVVAQGTSVVDSISTMSAVPIRLPLFPLVQLQYAVKCVGLAISATAGRIALNTAFLRKFGEGPATAVTASALDSFAGAVVNVVVVALAVLLSRDVPDVHLSGPDNLGRILLLLLAAVVLSAIVVALVPGLRRRLVLAVRSAWTSLRVVTDSPARALVLFGSNLASLLITAVALACMTRGLHPGPDFGQLVFVTAGAALFAAIVPVPGNVGVGEAALAAGLVTVGVPSSPAFAIAVTQRIATSYLPPIYGAWALRWLRREDYIG